MNKKSIESGAILNAPNASLYPYLQMLLAFLVFLLSYLGVRFFHPFHMGFSDTLLLVVYLLLAGVYARIYFPLKGTHYLHFGFILICCIPNALFDNDFLKFFNLLFILVQMGVLLLNISHKQIDSSGRFLWIDLINAMFYAPLQGLKKATSLFHQWTKENLHMKQAGGVLIGICITIPLLFLIVPLLASANASFYFFIFDFFHNLDNVRIELIYLLFSIPIFCYLYALLFGHLNCERQEVVQLESDELDNKMQAIARSPISVPLTIEIILSVVYALFLFLSTAEIFQNMNQSLSTFSYSSFARQGFFQLCAISFLNFLILVFLQLCTKKKTSSPLLWVKQILCIETLALLCTALLKMGLYIQAYGLTPLRIYSSWFMILLFGMFVLIIYHTHHKPEKLVLHITKYFCICFLLLNLMNINTLSTWYNENMPVLVQTNNEEFI